MSKLSPQERTREPRPLTKRQRQMLRDAYEHMKANGGKPGSFASLMRPCPRIGDLRVLNGLALRGWMTDGDHDDSPHAIAVWPRWIRITSNGAQEWERMLAERSGSMSHTCTPDVGSPCIPCGVTAERASKGKGRL